MAFSVRFLICFLLSTALLAGQAAENDSPVLEGEEPSIEGLVPLDFSLLNSVEFESVKKLLDGSVARIERPKGGCRRGAQSIVGIYSALQLKGTDGSGIFPQSFAMSGDTGVTFHESGVQIIISKGQRQLQSCGWTSDEYSIKGLWEQMPRSSAEGQLGLLKLVDQVVLVPIPRWKRSIGPDADKGHVLLMTAVPDMVFLEDSFLSPSSTEPAVSLRRVAQSLVDRLIAAGWDETAKLIMEYQREYLRDLFGATLRQDRSSVSRTSSSTRGNDTASIISWDFLETNLNAVQENDPQLRKDCENFWEKVQTRLLEMENRYLSEFLQKRFLVSDVEIDICKIESGEDPKERIQECSNRLLEGASPYFFSLLQDSEVISNKGLDFEKLETGRYELQIYSRNQKLLKFVRIFFDYLKPEPELERPFVIQ